MIDLVTVVCYNDGMLNELTKEISTLTRPELRQVKGFIAKLKERRSGDVVMERYSRDDLVLAIKESHVQGQRGETRPIKEFLAEICEEYGLSV